MHDVETDCCSHTVYLFLITAAVGLVIASLWLLVRA